jgi:hypothetical protein
LKTSAVPAVPPEQAAPQDAAVADTGSGRTSQHRSAKPEYDQPLIWLLAAAVGLCVLAGAAAAVSYAAQYRLVYAARHLAAAAALEAAIPDAAALVFACLGVALAVHGRRALQARLLNAASAGASVFMNVIAAAPGWRDLAVWAMPPAAYALASDTLIGVVRTGAVTRHQVLAGAAREFSFLAVAGGLALWLLRLTMAPRSTLAGFRAWVIEECPVAPGRLASRPVAAVTRAIPAGSTVPLPLTEDRRPGGARSRGHRSRGSGGPAASGRPRQTKTARFLALVAEQHGPLAGVPLGSVARISAALAPRADLNAGSARTALRRAVLAAQDGELR